MAMASPLLTHFSALNAPAQSPWMTYAGTLPEPRTSQRVLVCSKEPFTRDRFKWRRVTVPSQWCAVRPVTARMGIFLPWSSYFTKSWDFLLLRNWRMGEAFSPSGSTVVLYQCCQSSPPSTLPCDIIRYQNYAHSIPGKLQWHINRLLCWQTFLCFLFWWLWEPVKCNFACVTPALSQRSSWQWEPCGISVLLFSCSRWYFTW